MKKTLLFLSVFLLIIVGSQAQEKPEKNELHGIWQQCILKKVTEGNSIKFAITNMFPHYKILSESGELTNMVIEGYDAQNTNSFFAQLSAVGKYKITSENTMNEEIENHVQSIFKGKTTKMTFKVVENKYLFLSYNIEKDSLGKNIDINSIETWVRVEFPQQINLKVN